MSKMMEDFCAIRDGLIAELKTEEEPVWVFAWRDREGIDSEDFKDFMALSLAQFIEPNYALLEATIKDPKAVTSLAEVIFIMGWELSKLEQMKRQFDAA
jgi:hypothetical protein